MLQWPVSAFSDEGGVSCDEQIAALKRAGLGRMDLRSIDNVNCTVLPPEQAVYIREKLDAAGIQVQMFGSPIGKIDIGDDFSIDLQRLDHLSKLSPILGCSAVRIFSYYNKANQPHATWQTESLRRLQKLKELAERLGLVLYHENERGIFGDLCKDVLIIARHLRGAKGAFRLIFDFDNYNQSGENVWENWLQLRDFTDAFHLKDSKDHQHKPVGEGTGFVKEILVEAVKRNWNGLLAVEPHLIHSGAVAQTGPSGIANIEYAKMPPRESFQVACMAARKLIFEAGASLG